MGAIGLPELLVLLVLFGLIGAVLIGGVALFIVMKKGREGPAAPTPMRRVPPVPPPPPPAG